VQIRRVLYYWGSFLIMHMHERERLQCVTAYGPHVRSDVVTCTYTFASSIPCSNLSCTVDRIVWRLYD
jgi:hypothetical protein